MAKILFVTGYAHRDMGTCFVLASLLRNKGHDCLIAPLLELFGSITGYGEHDLLDED